MNKESQIDLKLDENYSLKENSSVKKISYSKLIDFFVKNKISIITYFLLFVILLGILYTSISQERKIDKIEESMIMIKNLQQNEINIKNDLVSIQLQLGTNQGLQNLELVNNIRSQLTLAEYWLNELSMSVISTLIKTDTENKEEFYYFYNKSEYYSLVREALRISEKNDMSRAEQFNHLINLINADYSPVLDRLFIKLEEKQTFYKQEFEKFILLLLIVWFALLIFMTRYKNITRWSEIKLFSKETMFYLSGILMFIVMIYSANNFSIKSMEKTAFIQTSVIRTIAVLKSDIINFENSKKTEMELFLFKKTFKEDLNDIVYVSQDAIELLKNEKMLNSHPEHFTIQVKNTIESLNNIIKLSKEMEKSDYDYSSLNKIEVNKIIIERFLIDNLENVIKVKTANLSNQAIPFHLIIALLFLTNLFLFVSIKIKKNRKLELKDKDDVA
jgi:hypothetical protein